MSEIPKGAKVRATFEGEYHGIVGGGRDHHDIVAPDGRKYMLPADASTVEVLAPPLPPEPPEGAYVEVRDRDLLAEPEIYVRRASYAHDEPPWDGWFSLRLMGEPPIDWAELHKDGAKVTRLYRADEQPQEKGDPEKYERAKGESDYPLWLHACGRANSLDPRVAPNADAYPERWCKEATCEAGHWTPLYRRSSDG